MTTEATEITKSNNKPININGKVCNTNSIQQQRQHQPEFSECLRLSPDPEWGEEESASPDFFS